MISRVIGRLFWFVACAIVVIINLESFLTFFKYIILAAIAIVILVLADAFLNKGDGR